MANYYNDNEKIKFEVGQNALMQRIVALKERDFADKGQYDYAPEDYEDAMDSYSRVLDIVGEVTADVVAPNAEEASLNSIGTLENTSMNT